MYLNQIYFGHGAFGVEAASRTFFGKSVSELAPAECALLAGLPKAPATYSPFEHPEAAMRRRGIVLTRMVDTGVMKPKQAKLLAETHLALVPPERRRTTGQYYLEYVLQYLEAHGGDLVFKGGLHVHTTLLPLLQLKAESSLRDGLRALQTPRLSACADGRGPPPGGRGRPRPQPQTGYIRHGGHATSSERVQPRGAGGRQPGSAFAARHWRRSSRNRPAW
jgi:penicillin-binding protein 1A